MNGFFLGDRVQSFLVAMIDWMESRGSEFVRCSLDNLNTHLDTSAGAFISEWNRKHGHRFVFHYTPTHGSWLNQIELWFSILSRRVLRYGSFATARDLVGEGGGLHRAVERAGSPSVPLDL